MTVPRSIRAGAILALAGFGACSTDRAPGGVPVSPLTAVETLRVGSVDEPETAFSGPRGLEIGPDGRLYVLERSEVRVFGADGTPLRRFGARGEGPGEFRSASQMVLVEDELRVLDSGLRRVTRFDLDGGVIAVEAYRGGVRDHPVLRGPLPNRLLGDMTLVATYGINQVREGWSDWYRRALPHVRVDLEGEIRDTLVMRSQQNGVLILYLDEPTTAPHPFPHDPLFEVWPSRLEAILVDRDVRAEASVAVHRLSLEGDTVWRRDVGYEPVAVDPVYVDSFVVALSEQLERVGFAGLREAETEIRDRMVVPDHVPGVDRVRLGRDGSVWLRLADRDPRQTRWHVLDGEGATVGVVTLPHAFTLLRASLDDVWGVLRGDFDVPYLVRYEVRADGQ